MTIIHSLNKISNWRSHKIFNYQITILLFVSRIWMDYHVV